MLPVMYGALVMGCLTVGLFFLRFWRRTQDRLFLGFGIAFWLLAANWLGLAFTAAPETRTLLYLVRLAAFVLIITSIVDKNRAAKGRAVGTR